MLKKYLSIISKLLFSLFFIGGGIAHFTNTAFYLPMMPKYLPMHLELVYISGVIEVILGVMLLIPKTTVIAAKGLILLLIAVFPANLNMYLNAEEFGTVDPTFLLIRLPLQALLILWAYSFMRGAKTSSLA
jgi:uncharacterized membrane protein